jgi:hypothetical protein
MADIRIGVVIDGASVRIGTRRHAVFPPELAP